MSQRRIRWTLRALRRLDEIGSYITSENPAAAKRVVGRIVSAVERLVAHPAMGRAGRISGTREVILGDIPYIIAYRVGDNIEILTILHTAQRPPGKL